jgi:hypothetical protein
LSSVFVRALINSVELFFFKVVRGDETCNLVSVINATTYRIITMEPFGREENFCMNLQPCSGENKHWVSNELGKIIPYTSV